MCDIARSMSKNKKCPCQSEKCHLGIHNIEPKQIEVSSNLAKVQRKFFMGHGIVTKDPKEAARIFLSRDHEKIEALLVHYRNGQLGVYMVPPMFFGQVPEAIQPSKVRYKKKRTGPKGRFKSDVPVETVLIKNISIE